MNADSKSSVTGRPNIALGPIPELLLLLARQDLTPAQGEYAGFLCRKITDWRRVAAEAEQRFVLPIAFAHISRIKPEHFSPEDRAHWYRRSLNVVTQSMHIMGAQRKLVRELLEPLQIKYVLFKGSVLAFQYYREPAWRYCRDIDILVSAGQIVAFLEAAQDQGYRLYPDREMVTRRDLRAMYRLRHEVLLYSPSGVLIEIHKKLDKGAGIYDTDSVLENHETIRIGDTPMRVLPTAEHFVYACLHHSRHYWSHLHWLTDLDVMLSHSSFSLDAARETAAQRGLGPTFEACVDLHRACARPQPWNDPELTPNGRDLLVAAAVSLSGHPEDERKILRPGRSTPDFAFPWQSTRWQRWRWNLQRPFSRLQPGYADYKAMPLPEALQQLYVLTRPFRALIKRLRHSSDTPTTPGQR